MTNINDIDNILITITESLNSVDKIKLINEGAKMNKNIAKVEVIPIVIKTKILCFSGLLDKNGKKVLVKTCKKLLLMRYNLFPPSYIPFAVAPPRIPSNICEKLLYKFGAILLINTSVECLIVVIML